MCIYSVWHLLLLYLYFIFRSITTRFRAYLLILDMQMNFHRGVCCFGRVVCVLVDIMLHLFFIAKFAYNWYKQYFFSSMFSCDAHVGSERGRASNGHGPTHKPSKTKPRAKLQVNIIDNFCSFRGGEWEKHIVVCWFWLPAISRLFRGSKNENISHHAHHLRLSWNI